MTPEELAQQEAALEQARPIKLEGNALFAEFKYEEAVGKYTEAIEAAPDGHKEQAVFYNNRATCYFKLNQMGSVIADCTAALRIDPDYAKCLLRRAQVRSHHPPPPVDPPDSHTCSENDSRCRGFVSTRGGGAALVAIWFWLALNARLVWLNHKP